MIIDNLDKLDKRDDLIVNSIINSIVIARKIVFNDLSNKKERILLVK